MIPLKNKKDDEKPDNEREKTLIGQMEQVLGNFLSLKKPDFIEMVRPISEKYFKSEKYFGNSENIGQHFYTKKFTSDFTLEMNRSVQKALDVWLRS